MLVRVMVVVSLIGALFWIGVTAAHGSDTTTRWEHFSESSACGKPYTRPPYATRSGPLPNSQAVLGPFGTYFGRSVGEIRLEQVLWTVPYSGGQRVRVHTDALPAFQQVAANLDEHARQGRVYPIKAVGAFYPRTVGGEYQISRHTFGTAIDINPAQNPYRRNGQLITDMPSWFVKSWTDAGFCWGGAWTGGEKDAMHFSWIGPGTGFGREMVPRPPRTSKKAFGPIDRTFTTVMAPVLGRYTLTVGAATANGAPNVVGLRGHPNGAVLDIASGYESFGSCSVRRWFIEDSSLLGADRLVLMDVDGDSRDDIVTVRQTGATSEIKVARLADGYEKVATFSRPIAGVVAAAGADFDSDHVADLWIATADGSLQIYGGPSFDALLADETLPSGAPHSISAADRDGGDPPELFAAYSAGSGSRVEVLRWQSAWALEQSFGLSESADDLRAMTAMDYDGDGRADLLTLDRGGRLDARIGNTSTGVPSTSWFVNPDPDCRNRVPLVFEGTFYDDERSVHVNGIEWIAGEKITVGCNPPFNDAFCPGQNLTRAQAATFIVRALGLPPATRDYFRDDQGHVLEGAINRLASAGITQGCNPPANDAFCPDREMTRAEFGTFLVRSLRLPSVSRDYFNDDEDHILEGAINRLAASGITAGCNPPTNDEFCPNRRLTRAETATFLTRAFK